MEGREKQQERRKKVEDGRRGGGEGEEGGVEGIFRYPFSSIFFIFKHNFEITTGNSRSLKCITDSILNVAAFR